MSDITDAFTQPGTNRGLFYDGAFQQPKTDAVISVTNPPTAQGFTTVPNATATDVDAAVAAARAAFTGWSALAPLYRAPHLRRSAHVALVYSH